jgi:outer membrane protein OmpA-like peptidoglycan-associated protein
MPNKYTRFSSLLLCGLAVALGAPAASAEELSVDQMVCALDPGCTLPSAPVRRMRGITVTASAVRPGSFDQQIMFAFNSADLTPEARKQLDKVAEALSNPRVATSTIIIHGHTDAVGGAEYNRVLSQQRAEAARQYFIKEHGIDPSRLVAKGHGKTQLLLPDDPNNDRNRRVQFENPHYAEAAAVTRPAPAPTVKTPPAAKTPAAPTPARTPTTPTLDDM